MTFEAAERDDEYTYRLISYDRNGKKMMRRQERIGYRSPVRVYLDGLMRCSDMTLSKSSWTTMNHGHNRRAYKHHVKVQRRLASLASIDGSRNDNPIYRENISTRMSRLGRTN